MKICENGIYRDMSAEEVAELEKLAAEQPAPEPTPEERIAALEKDNAELRDAMEALLSGRRHERVERTRHRVQHGNQDGAASGLQRPQPRPAQKAAEEPHHTCDV